MHGDAQSTATTLASVKRHWDARMSDDYVSGSEAFLGVRRAQAKSASFAHFLKTHVFSKNDAVARAAAGSHADAAASRPSTPCLQRALPCGTIWLRPLLSGRAGRLQVRFRRLLMRGNWHPLPPQCHLRRAVHHLPCLFRLHSVRLRLFPSTRRWKRIASSSTKPITINESDAWAAVSFPFAGAQTKLDLVADQKQTERNKKAFYAQGGYAPQWKDIAYTLQLYTNEEKKDGSTAKLGDIEISAANSSAVETALAAYKLDGKAFDGFTSENKPTAQLETLKLIAGRGSQSWPAAYVTYADDEELYKQRVEAYFTRVTKEVPSQETIVNVFQSNKENRRAALSKLYASMQDPGDDTKQKFIRLWEIIFSVEPIVLSDAEDWMVEEFKNEDKSGIKPLAAAVEAKIKEAKGDGGNSGRTDPSNVSDTGRGKSGDGSTGGSGAGGGDGSSPVVDEDAPDGDWYLIERPFKTFR